jgi:hypothetical protein
MNPHTRRQFLRGSGSIAIALPFFSSLHGRVGAAPTPRPRRFIGWFSSCGTINPAWTPSGTETAFTFNEILRPLDPYKGDVLILDGIDMTSSNYGPGSGHQKGMGHLLTGTELQSGSFVGGGGASAGFAGGISVDQLIAKRIGTENKLASVQLSVQAFNNDVWSRMSYTGPGVSLPPINDPAILFDRLFGGMVSDPAAAAKLREQRKSVLDGVASHFAAINAQLSGDDRKRLDAHLTAVRDVEKRLDAVSSSTCKTPTKPGAMDVKSQASFPVVGKLHMELLALALACDITRVATMQWSRATSPTVYSWLGSDMKESHHELSHAGDSDSVAKAKLVRINKWHAEQFAYFLGQLKAIEENPGETLLDNSLILWGSELAVGNTHSRKDMPFVLAGKAGGAVKTGRYVKYPAGTPHNNLLVAAANACGLTDIKTFGNPKYCTGALTKLAG